MRISPPDNAPTLGIASQDTHTVDAARSAVILSMHPATISFDEVVAANQTLAAYTVVGKNAAGELVPAVLGTTPAIGILPVAVTSGAAPLPGVPTWRSGHFDSDQLVWDATYATTQQRVRAFEGAPTPTTIRIGRVVTATPTS